MSQDEPDVGLLQFVTFLLGYYVPVWLNIRLYNSVTDGCLNYWHMLELAKQLSYSRVRDAAICSLRLNNYWGSSSEHASRHQR
ncbi:hypothetical protein Ciccas_012727 [Cichlidogyrus casuarinus]|uniref:Uncharacterized protein n=1 Tax=Cichlidogyrus casuarinus TaxID=1844966 RepID=A0ABD2PSL1_9PLAT